MYQIEKTDHKSAVDLVEDSLMEYILNTPVGIGEKLPNEFELSEQFGVGRSTIREAVKSLVSKRVLEIRRGSGTFVVSTTRIEDDPLGLARFDDKYKLAKELVEVRFMLEPEISAMAASNATMEERSEIKRRCDILEETMREGKNHVKYDIDFHSYIAHCSKNRVVEALIPIITSSVSTFANLTHGTINEQTIESHRMIANAIIAGDPMGAKYGMIQHLNQNRMKVWELAEQKAAKSSNKKKK